MHHHPVHGLEAVRQVMREQQLASNAELQLASVQHKQKYQQRAEEFRDLNLQQQQEQQQLLCQREQVQQQINSNNIQQRHSSSSTATTLTLNPQRFSEDADRPCSLAEQSHRHRLELASQEFDQRMALHQAESHKSLVQESHMLQQRRHDSHQLHSRGNHELSLQQNQHAHDLQLRNKDLMLSVLQTQREHGERVAQEQATCSALYSMDPRAQTVEAGRSIGKLLAHCQPSQVATSAAYSSFLAGMSIEEIIRVATQRNTSAAAASSESILALVSAQHRSTQQGFQQVMSTLGGISTVLQEVTLEWEEKFDDFLTNTHMKLTKLPAAAQHTVWRGTDPKMCPNSLDPENKINHTHPMTVKYLPLSCIYSLMVGGEMVGGGKSCLWKLEVQVCVHGSFCRVGNSPVRRWDNVS